MTTETDLDTLTGNAFSDGKKDAAIALARKYFGTSDGESDDKDLATALLSMAVLLNRRQAEKGRTDNAIAVLNIDELVTPQMERLLVSSTKAAKLNVFNFKARDTSKHWTDNRG